MRPMMNLPARPIAFAVVTLLLATLRAGAQDRYDFPAAAAYSEAHQGHALLGMIAGQVVFERYANGWSEEMPPRLASGTKSFNGVMLAYAIQEGLISGFDERLAEILVEWRDDPRKSRITYRQLIGLISGMEGGLYPIKTYAEAIQSNIVAEPGTQWIYGPNPFQSFGEAVKRKVAAQQITVADYVQTRILDPLGMQRGPWEHWDTGEPDLPSGANFTAREWIKFGEFVRQAGVYNGRRLLRQDLLDECFRSGGINPAYGVSWWLSAPGRNTPPDGVFALGAGQQQLHVVRSHQMTIVRFGDSTTFNPEEFYRILLGLGDLNCDGQVDFADINPFVLALSDPHEYQRRYPQCHLLRGDVNHDGWVDFGDINRFVDLLLFD